ncbi:class I SAM-dependent methyltransferase [Candidatus Mycolicibacterium alkanivorans]|uniref:Class I SAM-dependent methyltransferase n=1 Tax=Candidatus Mycolicibacterium alkanivorans TaxID=2954114 RepID=A0ABS9YT96_9MYCO|nr:class I SAM-dependent methyltransferase [Candidatus Mycolicibacterium alkanivorans]MCI4674455.1 class I SAM-dependent methyltransferase [Candidatus Mycolicibacterium alkanivorans]
MSKGTNGCRGCGEPTTVRVLDFGNVPAPDHFPLVTEPIGVGEACHGLAIDLCGSCGLAQLSDDDTSGEELHGLEPQALRDQAEVAVKHVAAAGWLRGDTVLEFESPHSGTWIPLVTEYGFSTTTSDADVVLDCFGIMHEPDQRSSFARRAEATREDGVLLLQYQSLVTIVEQGQWNALRHGHFAYYSVTTLARMLKDAGMSIASLWEFDLYGGTVLVAAVHGDVEPDESVRRLLAKEEAMGITTAESLAVLQETADQDVDSLVSWLEEEAAAGHTVYAYAAASKAVSLFSRAGITTRLVTAVADASPAKQGRRMPATDIPIVSPAELLAANPDRVLLTLADLLPEVSARFPELDGRWRAHGL